MSELKAAILRIKLEITNGSRNAIHSRSGQSELSDERPLQLTGSLVIAAHYCKNQSLTSGMRQTKILGWATPKSYWILVASGQQPPPAVPSFETSQSTIHPMLLNKTKSFKLLPEEQGVKSILRLSCWNNDKSGAALINNCERFFSY